MGPSRPARGEQRGENASAGVLKPVLLWVAAGFVLVIVGPGTLLGWGNLRGQPVALVMMAIFWGMGLFLAWRAAMATLRYLRFGVSLLRLDHAPSLGGHLEGVIEAPRALIDAPSVELRVECLRTEYWKPSDAAQRSDPHSVPIWRGSAVLDTVALARDAHTVEVPFSIALPADAEASGWPDDRSEIDWTLSLRAPMAGIDYQESFSLAVGPASSEPPRPPARSMPVSGRTAAAPRSYRLTRRGDRVAVRFPRPSLLVWPFVIVAMACLLALLDGNPYVGRYRLGLRDWGGWVLAVVFVLNVVGTMMVATGIDVDADLVRIRRGPFGIGIPKRLRRRDVAQIRPKPSRSTPPSYAIEFVTAGGDSVRAVVMLTDVEEAQRLAAELSQAVRLV
jgi:hypothetical protein